MENSKGNLKLVSHNRRKKRKSFKIIAVIVALVLAVYLLAALFVALSKNLSTTVALNGYIQESISTSGYIFRDQTVINAPGGGYIDFVSNEGDRVKKGQIIAYLYPSQPDVNMSDKIKKLTERLSVLKGLEGELAVYTDGSVTSEKRIADKVRGISDKRTKFDLSDISKIKTEINTLISTRNSAEYTEGISAKEEEILRIEQELQNLKSQLGVNGALLAPTDGVFSTRIDGLETMLSLDKAMQSTPSYLENLNINSQSTSQMVEFSQPVCKIVDNYNWYYATVLDADKVEDLSVGSQVDLAFYDLTSSSIVGNIKRISDKENNKCAVVVKTNRYVDGIYSISEIKSELITVSVEGIKLPVDAIRVKDGVTGVYVIRLDVARFVPVNVKYRNEDFSIVSAKETDGFKLKLYDEVIVECRNLEDGKIVR